MALDGTWKITVNTPMGAQEGKLILKTNGASLTGSQSGPNGSMVLQNGKIDGNKATWTADMTEPMPLKLEFSVTVTGDQMSGEVKAGDFGASPLNGTRQA
jgi:hypothetical protein